MVTPTMSRLPLTPHDWVALGPHGVGDLGCSGSGVAFTTGTQPLTKLNHREDVIEVADRPGGPPRVVASAEHGGTLTDAVRLAGSWLVYLEYQQHLQSTSADFWYLDAVNLTTGGKVQLARATAGPALGGLPWYDAGGRYAVWNQLDQKGKEVLRTYDFTDGALNTLPLPSSMSPVEPAVSGSSVVFVDNSTDPDRAHEDFFGRRGSLRRFDLTTKRIATLNPDPTAWMPVARGGEVVWTVMAPPPSPVAPTSGVVAAAPLGGGRTTIVGGFNPVTPQTNGSIVVWYDSSTLGFMVDVLRNARHVQLRVGGLGDTRSVYALCGNRLFFARPLVTDGGTSTIRFVDLTSLPG